MTKISDVYNIINRIAPFSLQENWDNSGLILGDMNKSIEKVVIALDITKEIITEAVNIKAELIVTHHPIIFNAVKRIEYDSLIAQLIKNDIAVISAHTNLDIANGGVNDILCNLLELNDFDQPLEITKREPYYHLSVYTPVTHIEEVYKAMKDAGAGELDNYSGCAFYCEGTGTFIPLEGSDAFIGEIGKREYVNEARIEMILPKSKSNAVLTAMQKAHPYETPAYNLVENLGILEDFGIGRIGMLEKELSCDTFAKVIKDKLDCKVVRYNDCEKAIKRVAVCSGSGGSLYKQAFKAGADALVTGDVKHDIFLDAAALGITIFDAGHFATENIVLDYLQKELSASLKNVDVIVADKNKDILKYI